MEEQEKMIADFFEAAGQKIYLVIGQEDLGLHRFMEKNLSLAARNENYRIFRFEIWEGEHSRHFLYRWLSEMVNGAAYRGHGGWSDILGREESLPYQLRLLIEQDIRPLEIRFLEAVRFVSRVLEPNEQLILAIIPRTGLRDRIFADFLQAILSVLPVHVKMLVCQDEGDVLVGRPDFSPSNRLRIDRAPQKEVEAAKDRYRSASESRSIKGDVVRILAHLVHPVEMELLRAITGKTDKAIRKTISVPDLADLVEWTDDKSARLAYPRLVPFDAVDDLDSEPLDKQVIAYYEKRLLEGNGTYHDVLFHSLGLFRLKDADFVATQILSTSQAKLAMGGGDICEQELDRALDLVGESRDRLRAKLHLALGEIRESRRRYEEALAALEPALDILRKDGDSLDLIRALELKGSSAFSRRDTEAATSAFEEAIDLAKRLGRVELEADLTSQLAYVFYSMRDFQQAERLYRESLSLYTKIAAADEMQGRSGEAAQWSNLGHTSYARGDFKAAEEHHRRARDIHDSLGNRRAVANQWGYLGHTYFALQAFDQAIDAYETAAGIHEEMDEPLKAVHRRASIGYTHYVQRNLDTAREFFEKSMEAYRNLGDPEGEAAQLSNLGLIQGDQGAFDDAITDFEQAALIYRELGDPMNETTQLLRMGHVRRGQKQYDEARKLYDQVLDRYRKMEYAIGEADTQMDLGQMCGEMEKWKEAEASFMSAQQIYARLGNKEKETMCCVLSAQVERAQGQTDAALGSLECALGICREIGNQLGSTNVLSQMGLIQHECKNHLEAERLYQEALQGFQRMEEREGEANLLANLGTLYYEIERVDEAREVYERAIDILRSMRHALGLSGVLQNISYVYEKQEKYSEACACLKEARQICNHYEMAREVEVIDERLESVNRQADRSLEHMRRELFPGLSSDASKGAKKKGGVGRNDPCPCGSGKKYKKCCGA
ncbi:MAG: tetratricopeptide repeat protein [Deltaproteobacteria bacterium]|nr:tetratricopeptide repeat protein [Deltaproteobacteria bacterium]